MFNVLCVIQVNPSLRQVCVCVIERERENTGDEERKKVCVQVSCTGFIKFCSFDNIPAAVGVESLLTHS